MLHFIRQLRPTISQMLNNTCKAVSTSSSHFTDAVEELKSNPYYEKYSKKIQSLQQSSPDEFESRIASHAEKKKPRKKLDDDREGNEMFKSGTAKPDLTNSQFFTKPKTLDDLMKTELLSDKTSTEIEKIWVDYHKSKDVLVAVIPGSTYLKLHEKGMEFGTFVFPIPRKQGYEFILSQFNGHEVHFTPLIAYQMHKENAPECLTLIHYTDLIDDKGIVLMKGDYNTDVLQSYEAQCLVNQLQLYYSQDNEKRLKMLQRFTYSPNEFKHMDLIAELDCLTTIS